MGCLSFPGKLLQVKPRQSSSHRRGVAVAPADQLADSCGHGGGVGFSGQEISVRKYNWEEIQQVTANFATLIGSGGFSSVYLDVRKRAVKTHSDSHFLHRVFLQELEILLHLRHPFIVTLLGYCDDHDRGALVFEYFSNGSLQDLLHGDHKSKRVIPWRRRMVIAFQLAQALEHLHENCDPQIVHGDIKASNVLLDKNLNCKLCDFGSAKKGFSGSVSNSSAGRTSRQYAKMMTGSPGYTDPHYLRTGLSSKKNDIYSYGVVLLELVTGAEAFCCTRNLPLTSIFRPALEDARTWKIEEVIDSRLMAASPPSAAERLEVRSMLSLAASCLHESPTSRPSATQICATIISSSSLELLENVNVKKSL